MEEAAAPLLEKTQLAALDQETTTFRSQQPPRPIRQAWTTRVLSVLLPLSMVLGLLFVMTSRGHAACVSPPDAILANPHAMALVSASKRAEADTDAPRPTLKPKVLDCFQVAQPVLTPDGPATERSRGPSSSSGAVTVTLMDHVFGNSYGAPFVGNYVPPASVKFNRVVMNFTVVSQGRQFDRLALMYLNDTEVWRTSTAEPVSPPGIRWVYLKDMTAYLALWRSPQKIIFDLGNLQNDKYTGSFNATLTATFFQSDEVAVGGDGSAPPSDVIIPVSARKSAVNGVSQFTLPKEVATDTISNFPRNARRAVFSVSATGQADEEFWWSNVLQSDILAFNATAGTLTGFSPFREVQVLIDGQLAGVQWPFPVVFTGGVVPSLHRPISGADVFDLREHEIDISPWLSLLCDDQPHTFSIVVTGLNDDGKASGTATLTKTVAASWYVTGKIFVWLDGDSAESSSSSSVAVTTGSKPVVSDTGPTISITQSVSKNATGANTTLVYSVSVARTFSVQAVIASGQGQQGQNTSRAVSWSQSLSYSNQGVVSDFGNNQVNNFSIRGNDRASSGAGSAGDSSAVAAAAEYAYSADYEYPLYCNTTTQITKQGNMTLWAHMDQGLRLQVSGVGVFPTGLEVYSSRGGKNARFAAGSLLETRVSGTATFFQTGDGKNSSGFGTTNQLMRFGGFSAAGVLGATPDVTLYTRNVTAVNQTILFDHETIAGGHDTTVVAVPVSPSAQNQYAQAPLNGGTGTRVFMGRGGANPEVAVNSTDGADGTPGGVQAAAVVDQSPMSER